MLVLGLEGAAGMVGAALCRDGTILAELNVRQPQAQSELLLPLVDELLRHAGVRRRDVDGVAVGTGPGTYTGLRITIATGQGLAMAWQRPLVGVCTLDALAVAACPGGGHAAVLLPARGRTVTAAILAVTPGRPVTVSRLWGPAMLPVDDFAPVLAAYRDRGPVVVTGPGVDGNEERLFAPAGAGLPQVAGLAVVPDRMARAGMVAILGEQALARGEGGLPWSVRPEYAKDYTPVKKP